MATEKRLIDASAFKEFLEDVRQRYLEEGTFNSNFAAVIIETVQDNYLELAPTVDAVEVVRCKDCVRGRTELHTRAGEVIKCSLFRYDDVRQYKDPTDYCSHGVRKDREGK